MKYSNIDGIELGQFNEIIDELGYWNDEVYPMGDFNVVLSGGAYEAVRGAFYGERFGYIQDSFNPNDEYFAFNAHGNLVSINEYYLQEYFDQYKDEIIEYANENEIELDGVEEEEE